MSTVVSAADTALAAVWEPIPVLEEPTAPEVPKAPSQDFAEEGVENEFLAPVPEVNGEETVDRDDPASEADGATIAAGVTVGLLTAGFGGWWFYTWYKRRREED